MNVLLSSHLLDEVERTCSSVVILKDGRVTASGGIDELKGAGRGVTVDVEWGAPQLAERLASRGLVVGVDGPRLVVTAPAEMADTHPDLNDRLFEVVRDDVADLGLAIRRLSNRTVSLEDVFLEVGT